MCGCNSNVKFVKGEANVVAQFVVPAPKRRLTTSCDTLGKCGIIQENTFTVSEDVTRSTAQSIRFSDRRANSVNGSSYPKDSFLVSMNGSHMTAIGLRQVAEEFAAMADELDGQKTVVSLAGNAMPVKLRKASKKKKARK